MDRPKTLRAFIALILPQEIAEFLAQLQQSLRSRGLNIGWVRPGNLHLTFRFFGHIPETDVPRIAGVMHNTAQTIPSFELSVQGLGVFPGIKRPRVLWAGLGGSTQLLKQLYGRLDASLDSIGFKSEKRGFAAHLTLGRIRKPIDSKWLLALMADAGGFAPRSFLAQRLVLFKSDLRPRGPEYTSLSEVVLAAGTCR